MGERLTGTLGRLGLALCAFQLAFGLSATARAVFGDQATASSTMATTTLQPATDPATSAGTCVAGEGDAIVVTWTRSTSRVSGYEILRATAPGGPYSVVATPAGQSTESYTDTPLAFSTTYHYVIRGRNENWRSADTGPVSRTTRSSSCV